MEIDTKIKGITAQIKDSILVIQSETPLRMLSAAVYNGGLKEANALVNIQVPMGCGENQSDVHWSPEEFIIEQLQKLQLPKDKTVGLMTAANVHNVSVSSEKFDETTLTVLATAGATVAVAAGEPAASKSGFTPGTINIVVLVDGNMTESCMVDAVKTITEAKTVALRELDIRSRFSGDIATGTLTDSVAVGCTKKGAPIQFAGTFTLLGELIGKCVRNSVKEAMHKQEGLTTNRPLLERLAERSITSEIIISLFDSQKGAVRCQNISELKRRLELALCDQKIAALVLAGLRLDDDVSRNMIPTGSVDEVDEAAFAEITQNILRNLPEQILQKRDIFKKARIGPCTMQVFLALLDYLCK